MLNKGIQLFSNMNTNILLPQRNKPRPKMAAKILVCATVIWTQCPSYNYCGACLIHFSKAHGRKGQPMPAPMKFVDWIHTFTKKVEGLFERSGRYTGPLPVRSLPSTRHGEWGQGGDPEHQPGLYVEVGIPSMKNLVLNDDNGLAVKGWEGFGIQWRSFTGVGCKHPQVSARH